MHIVWEKESFYLLNVNDNFRQDTSINLKNPINTRITYPKMVLRHNKSFLFDLCVVPICESLSFLLFET